MASYTLHFFLTSFFSAFFQSKTVTQLSLLLPIISKPTFFPFHNSKNSFEFLNASEEVCSKMLERMEFDTYLFFMLMFIPYMFSYLFSSSGLLDVPICAVHDDGPLSKEPSKLLRAPSSAERRSLYSFHIPRISSAPYRIFNQNPMLNSHRYPINTITGMSTYPRGFKDLANDCKDASLWKSTLI